MDILHVRIFSLHARIASQHSPHMNADLTKATGFHVMLIKDNHSVIDRVDTEN